MKRTDFIKSLAILSLQPKTIKTQIIEYQKIYLLQCFVRGFQYYRVPHILDELNESRVLELVREPKNQYDKNALALHHEGRKIGYIPAEENTVLSILLDADLLQLHVEIAHVQPDAENWERIYVLVYALKEKSGDAKIDFNKDFTVVRNPQYDTICYDQTLTKIYNYNPDF